MADKSARQATACLKTTLEAPKGVSADVATASFQNWKVIPRPRAAMKAFLHEKDIFPHVLIGLSMCFAHLLHQTPP